MSESHPGGQPAQPDGPPNFSKEPPAAPTQSGDEQSHGQGHQSPGYGQPSAGYGQQPPGQQPPGYGQPPPGYGHQPPGYGQELSPSDQRMWGMLAHLSALLSGLFGLTFVGPLVVYLVYKERGRFVREQAAEALNFQILVNIVAVVGGFLGLIVTAITFGIGAILVFPLLVVLAIGALVFVIMAAVAANKGENYRYPINWRLVS